MVQKDAAAAELAAAKADCARLQASVSGGRAAGQAGQEQAAAAAAQQQQQHRLVVRLAECLHCRHAEFAGQLAWPTLHFVQYPTSCPCPLPPLRHAELKQGAQQMRRMLQQLQGEKEAAQGALPMGAAAPFGVFAAMGRRGPVQKWPGIVRVPCPHTGGPCLALCCWLAGSFQSAPSGVACTVPCEC